MERRRRRSLLAVGMACTGWLLLFVLPRAHGDGEAAPAKDAKEATPPADFLPRLKDAGITPFFNYTGEVFGNFTGGTGRGANYEGLLRFGLTLDLEKLVTLPWGGKWTGGSAYFAILYPHGLGITNEYVHDYNVLSSIDAYDSWRLFEAWVQQDFADHRFSIRIGQLTTDNNFFVSDDAGLYLNSVFGVLGTATHDVMLPTYPVASPGVMLQYTPTPAWYFQAMVVSDNPGTQDGNNKHGIRYDFGGDTGALVFYEAGYVRRGTEDAPILEGKYKLGGYYDSGSFPDNAGGTVHHGDYAFYAVADQQLYREALKPKETFRGLSAFTRWSLAPEDRNPVTFYFDAGLNYTGLLPRREKDVVGVAFSYERLSPELRQSNGDPMPSHHEHVLETTYLWNLNDHVSVQPDLQYIFNPGAVGTIPNAFVAGLRFGINF